MMLLRHTTQYSSENVVQSFIDDKCIEKSDSKMSASNLYSEYKTWCGVNGYMPQNIKNFTAEMKRLKFPHKRSSSGNIYEGIELRLSVGPSSNWDL